MVVETQNEDRESGQTSFVLRASETKRMVRSLTGIETLLVGVGGSGRQDGLFRLCCHAN